MISNTIKICVDLYGEFNKDFIEVKNKTITDIRREISEQLILTEECSLVEALNKIDIEIYIVENENGVIIKK